MDPRAPADGGSPIARRLALLFLLLAGAVSVYGFDVTLPGEVLAYKDLPLVLNLEPGLEVEQARFYLLTAQRDIPQYASFKEKDGAWSTVIPSAYLRGEELIYYVQIRTSKGELRRYPERGTKKVRLIPDTRPPSVKVLSPASAGLVRDREQMVVCKTEDESEIVQYEILYKDRLITKAAMLQGMLSFFITPAKDEPYEAVVEVRLTDSFGNTSSDILGFVLENAAEPAYAAEGDFIGNLDAGYSLGMGEMAKAVDLASLFSDITHEVSLDYELGGWTKLKAGPARLQLSASLADNISVLDIPQAYPNSWIADFQNLINLWNPWDFENEFDYSGEVPRRYYNENKFLARFSFYDPILSYAFGDQKLSYQKETIKDFRFRGSSVALDTPFLDISAAKGLAELGLYQQAWPRNFFGVQAGLSVFDYWWLQANLSFISSLQGRNEDISVTGISPIGVLYDLEEIDPEESLVFGMDMGTKNGLFRLSAGFGLSLRRRGNTESPARRGPGDRAG